MTEKNNNLSMIVIVLLALNAVFGIYIAFFKPDAYSLEQLKVGGRENMKMAMQLYTSDIYKQEQRSTLEQILGSLDQMAPTQQQNTPSETLSLVLDDVQLEAIKTHAYIM